MLVMLSKNVIRYYFFSSSEYDIHTVLLYQPYHTALYEYHNCCMSDDECPPRAVFFGLKTATMCNVCL